MIEKRKFGYLKPFDRINTQETSLWKSPNVSFGSGGKDNSRTRDVVREKLFRVTCKFTRAKHYLFIRLMYPNWWKREINDY